MISVKKAHQIILDSVNTLGADDVIINDALNRVVFRDVAAGFNVPMADNSAMDGYALRSADTNDANEGSPAMLRITGEARAGAPSTEPVKKGCATKIMTGAVIPDGADCVIKLEDADMANGYLLLCKPVRRGAYVRHAGEDIKTGAVVFGRGDRLNAAGIGVLASLKMQTVPVYKKPTAAILCSGDELIGVDGELAPGQIVS